MALAGELAAGGSAGSIGRRRYRQAARAAARRTPCHRLKSVCILPWQSSVFAPVLWRS